MELTGNLKIGRIGLQKAFVLAAYIVSTVVYL